MAAMSAEGLAHTNLVNPSPRPRRRQVHVIDDPAIIRTTTAKTAYSARYQSCPLGPYRLGTSVSK